VCGTDSLWPSLWRGLCVGLTACGRACGEACVWDGQPVAELVARLVCGTDSLWPSLWRGLCVGLTACGRACGEALLVTWEANDNCLTASRLPCEPLALDFLHHQHSFALLDSSARVLRCRVRTLLLSGHSQLLHSQLCRACRRGHFVFMPPPTHPNTSAPTTPLTRISPRCTLLLYPFACCCISLFR
jgi:F0F1-type ATP synthase membrane subunit c/vacuolar-type H+-ATPase subunit K